MSKSMKWISLTAFYCAVASMVYVSVSLSLLLVSSVMTDRGISSNVLIRKYQAVFFVGTMDSWLTDPRCAVFDRDLVYIPRIGTCEIDTAEFRTTLTFDENGRFSGSKPNKLGIAALGDSFTMGWGVNDDETYAAILEKKTGRPVYNLGVPSYGTYRELLRLEKSGLIPKVDTIIIQYCWNDLNENIHEIGRSLRGEPLASESRELFNSMYAYPILPYGRVRFFLQSAVEVPVLAAKEAFSGGRGPYHKDFTADYLAMNEILSRFPWLMSKNVIVFYTNGRQSDVWGENFAGKGAIYSNFEELGNRNSVSATFVDISPGQEYHYVLDGHLNRLGHEEIAERLFSLVSNIRE